MSSEREGKIALVTGASRGIGAGIATALAQAGADVAVNFVSREAAPGRGQVLEDRDARHGASAREVEERALRAKS